MQKKVREVFLRMASEMGKTTAPTPEEKRTLDRQRDQRLRWITINAGRSVEQVTNDIWAAIEPLIHGTSEPLGRLWASGLEGDDDSG
jgi:thymidylate kinase